VSAMICGIALAAFAYMSVFAVALVLMVAVGGGVILAAASANTILQTIVDDSLRGRVAGFYTLAFLGVAPLGNLAAGALAERLSAPAAFAINGVIATLAAAWFWHHLPAIRGALRSTYQRLGIIAER
jgi:MFS family permease